MQYGSWIRVWARTRIENFVLLVTVSNSQICILRGGGGGVIVVVVAAAGWGGGGGSKITF
jgi:hypothetical protein